MTQVCSKSDVNRSTFYAYYQDVGELLSELEDGVLEKIPGAQKVPVARTDSEFIDTLERFFDYVKENRRLFYHPPHSAGTAGISTTACWMR